MTQIQRHVATAVAILALTALVAGCSPEDSANGSTVTASTSTVSGQTPAAALPASDFVEGLGYSFATPSKRIQCRAVDSTFACQTEADPQTVGADNVCGFYPGVEQGRAVRFGFFDDRPQPCATIIQGEGFDSPHTLQYGQSVAFQLETGRTVTCTSAVAGLTCTQGGTPGGNGFVLSTDSFALI